MTTAVRVPDFDVWRAGYGGATINVYIAGTTTLADLFLDEAGTLPADNPQILDSMTLNGVVYGKFLAPVYCAQAFQIAYNSVDVTGTVRPPLTSLDSLDASQAGVTLQGQATERQIRAWATDIVQAEWYGEIGATAATNTTTITAAIAACSGNGGGEVWLPEGTIPFTTLTIPQNVVLRGMGRTATVLQSEIGAISITLSGDRAGLRFLTLDGVSLSASSVAVYGVGLERVIMDHVLIKRFETICHFKGGRFFDWIDVTMSDCVDGLKGHGDLDAGDTGNGTEFAYNRWRGGLVELATGIAIDLSYEDAEVHHNEFAVQLDANATAVHINGARFTKLNDTVWGADTANTTDLDVEDDDATDANNTVIGLEVNGGQMIGGAVNYTETCESIRWKRVDIQDVDFTYTLPDHNILYEDCYEDASVTISGETYRHWRKRTQRQGGGDGATSNDTPVEIWSIQLAPGQAVYAEAKVCARRRTGGGDVAMFHVACGAHRPGALLDYDNQTADFTEGETLTGGTSGATAIIQQDDDAGASGTLTLISIDGAYQNNEAVTDGGGGAALADGVLTLQDVELDAQGNRYVTSFPSTSWNLEFVPNEDELELHFTGEAADIVDVTVEVEVTST